MRKGRRGFTLVEIMIVVAIIGLLAAIAIPNFVKARNEAREKACINNLRIIDAAKDQAALEYSLADSATIAWGSLASYVKGGTAICPLSTTGDYVINSIGANPTCPNVTTAGHTDAAL